MKRYIGFFDRKEMVAVICFPEALGSLEWYGKDGLEMRNIEEDTYEAFKGKHDPRQEHPTDRS